MTKGVGGVGSKVIFFFLIGAVAKLSARQESERYVRDETIKNKIQCSVHVFIDILSNDALIELCGKFSPQINGLHNSRESWLVDQ